MLSRESVPELSQQTGLPPDWYPEGLVWPDYAGGGLFNLAVSLARACGAEVPAEYPDLQLAGSAASKCWRETETLVFLLVDGLGDDFLSRHRDIAPNLWRERARSLTSVFPSTTATAITTLMTAEPAAVHGLLGWYVRDDASGSIIAPLPMRQRAGSLVHDPAVLSRILNTPPMLARAQRQSCFVTLRELAVGSYSQHHRREAGVELYESLDKLADGVVRAVSSMQGQRFVYAYTPVLDSTGHDFGMDSDEARAVLAEVDKAYLRMREALPDAQFVVSADHGFIDNPAAHQIVLSDHPDIYSMLRGPLTGERRAAYCHVKPECQTVFGLAVAERFGDQLRAIPAALAFDLGMFGPGMGSETLLRGGDWLLIPRADWVVLDRLPGESSPPMVGVHGGLSASEMRIPLILSPML